jgi:hypothetical protein
LPFNSENPFRLPTVTKFPRDSCISFISLISRGSFSYLKPGYRALGTVSCTERGSRNIHTESDLFSGVFHEQCLVRATVARYFAICNLISFIISFLLKSWLFLYLKSQSVKVFSCGFDFKMLKYIKRRRVDEEEDSENETKLSEPSTSKAEKEVTDKFAHITTVPWPWVLRGPEAKTARLHCTLFAGKNCQIGLWSRQR